MLAESGKRKGQNVPWLVADIKAIFLHCAGMHESCRPGICQHAGQVATSSNTYQLLMQSALFEAINILLDDLSRKASRLRLNLNTNRAESSFALWNKYNMGKRVDLASRGELYRRSLAMAASWNDPEWMEKWYRRVTAAEPGLINIY